MRRAHIRLAVLICVASALGVLLWNSVESTRGLAITPTAIDFDEVKLGSDTSRRLTIRNPTHGPALVRMAADCSCITLSRAELKLPPRSEATVDVTLSRKSGDRRERWYTFLESELDVTALTDGGSFPRSIPIKAKFFEPYAVDDSACQMSGMATELGEWVIPFSAAAPEAGRPTIGEIPSFVESAEVTWDEEFSAGEVFITVKRNTPPGHHAGQIDLRLASAIETSPQSYALPLEAQVQAPYRFSPGTAVLGGLMDLDSEIVTLEGIPDVRCSIESVACESELVHVEQHDGVTFTVQRRDAGRRESDQSPVTHVEIDVEYKTDGMPVTVKENFPVYVRTQGQGGAK